MALAFESLFPITRGKKTYYSIFDARQTLFSRTDGLTRMTWIKLLSIVVSPASEGEQDILERNFPWECQNHFTNQSGRFDQAIVLRQSTQPVSLAPLNPA